MSQFTARIDALPTPGHFCYRIYQNGACKIDVADVNSIAAALDGVKTGIAGLLGAESVVTVTMSVGSA